jgi:hypothetical protein
MTKEEMELQDMIDKLIEIADAMEQTLIWKKK